jgi:hypothetical protein
MIKIRIAMVAMKRAEYFASITVQMALGSGA